VSAAEQVYYAGFDFDFFKLPPNIQARIESRIDQMDLRLGQFPHIISLAAIAIASGLETTVSFTLSMSRKTEFTCWRWAIDERFTVRSDQRNGVTEI